MNIHEYQAKAVLREFGAPVSRGVAVLKAEDAEKAAKDLGGPLWVVKAVSPEVITSPLDELVDGRQSLLVVL